VRSARIATIGKINVETVVREGRKAEEIEKLIAEEFSADVCHVDFTDLIKKRSQPTITAAEPPNFDIPQRVLLSNEEEELTTVLEIQAEDRIGLLYDIFTALSHLDAAVLSARISTQAGAAIDRFHLLYLRSEKKIIDHERLQAIDEAVSACLEKKTPVEVIM
jgi:UTP:GlnB (protein PII) uridylyltransferase